ncbi:MAG: class II aldolase/adducin family protein [Acidimicrobiia bacterium]
MAISATAAGAQPVDVLDAPAMRRAFPSIVDFEWMTKAQQLAVLARALAREGYADHSAGHITVKDDDDTLLVNPFPLAWDEIGASDVLRIDPSTGEVLEGRWPVSPAIKLHLELHRARPDVGVSVHNHPEWSTVWAAVGVAPPIYDQNGALARGDVVFHDEYDGTVVDGEAARRNVAAVGSATMALLANHGVLVTADTVPLAHLRCLSLEARCRLAWRVHALAEARGRPMPTAIAADLGDKVDRVEADRTIWPFLWEAAVRRELRADRTVLD